MKVLFSIGGLDVYTMFVAALIFVFVFLLIFWLTSHKELKTNSIFDIAFITLGCGLIGSRLLGMFAHLSSYLDQGWSVLPLTDSADGSRIDLFRKLPWAFFRFNDTNFVFIGIFVGIVIGLLLLYQNSNQKKTIYILFDRIILAYAVSALILIAGIQIAGAGLGALTTNGIFLLVTEQGTRFALEPYRISVLVVFLISYQVLRKSLFKQDGMLTILFLFVYGGSEFYLRTLADVYQPDIFAGLDYYQVISLAFMVAGIIFLLPKFNVKISFFSRKKKEKNQQPQGELERVRRSHILNSNTNNPNRFVQSFSDRKRTITDRSHEN
jgi:prolipoprotein diacylglyceryltransferase